ncbi:MAG: flagellin [Alphaproteobacteria bacterium]|nr:flagellin [Alphaproteobacteria bacterium]
MPISINTNVGAMVALQSLNTTNTLLDRTQQRVNTGLRVSGSVDDAASYQIAQKMKGDRAGYEAVQVALGLGLATVNTGVKAAEAVNDLLVEMKAKVVQANQAGLDNASLSALNDDFTALATQITTIVSSASFNGKNLITSGATSLTVLSTVDGSTITVSAVALDRTALGIQTQTLATSSGALQALTTINSAIVLAATNAAKMGSAAKAVGIQSDYSSKLLDIITQGIGSLIDADLSRESANLQALQIKQQLGVQALSIANSRPQVLLGLFG